VNQYAQRIVVLEQTGWLAWQNPTARGAVPSVKDRSRHRTGLPADRAHTAFLQNSERTGNAAHSANGFRIKGVMIGGFAMMLPAEYGVMA
jgi:hypothetical protein